MGTRQICMVVAVTNATGRSDLRSETPLRQQDGVVAHHELAELIVSTLSLEIPPEAIEPTAPLFVDGLGLDSIDALELSLAISRTYGFELRSDDGRNGRIFASLDSLACHIAAHRTR